MIAGADEDGDVARGDGTERAGWICQADGGFVDDLLAGGEECLNGIGGGGVAVFVFEAFGFPILFDFAGGNLGDADGRGGGGMHLPMGR